MRGGVDEHQHVVADALSRSEWSAKRSRSECEVDHERRSVDWVRRDRGVCDVLMLDGVDEHRHVVADALDYERRSADMCKKCLLSVSLVNPTGKSWIRPESSCNSKVICHVFRLRNRFATPVSAHTSR